MRHDPNNSQCDKVQYGDAPDVRCTCDIDSPDDAPVPSTRVGETSAPMIGQSPGHVTKAPSMYQGVPVYDPNGVTLTGRQAATHRELVEAGRDYQAARVAFERAQARYKAAIDAHMQAVVPEVAA